LLELYCEGLLFGEAKRKKNEGAMRLLVVEDETLVAKGVQSACIEEGFACHIAYTGSEGIEMIKFYDYDAIILDLGLPDMHGITVLEKIKNFKKRPPVLVLSGLNATDDKVKCLAAGADDYLTKPFSRIELLARVYAIVRRVNGLHSSVITVGPISIDIFNRVVTIHGVEIALTSKEYAIIELLSIKRGAVVPKETFLSHIYGGLDEPDLKIVDVFICKLRKKMAAMSGGLNFIETVWGRGYTLKENPDVRTYGSSTGSKLSSESLSVEKLKVS
jgi:two-component system cell cycle response regulator CtrA